MPTVVFKCRRSGNCVRFSNESDIAEMRKHEGYEEVKNDSPPVNPSTESNALPKRRGRPPRSEG